MQGNFDGHVGTHPRAIKIYWFIFNKERITYFLYYNLLSLEASAHGENYATNCSRDFSTKHRIKFKPFNSFAEKRMNYFVLLCPKLLKPSFEKII